MIPPGLRTEIIAALRERNHAKDAHPTSDGNVVVVWRGREYVLEAHLRYTDLERRVRAELTEAVSQVRPTPVDILARVRDGLRKL